MEPILVFSNKYFFLSNFYYFNGSTVEHKFQAEKFDDQELVQKILNAKSPQKAKQLGKSQGLKSNWDQIKIEVMYKLLLEKFAWPELQKQLLDTKKVLLVEGNYWHDNFWGSCNCHDCKRIKGENHLGILLMKVREFYYQKSIIHPNYLENPLGIKDLQEKVDEFFKNATSDDLRKALKDANYEAYTGINPDNLILKEK